MGGYGDQSFNSTMMPPPVTPQPSHIPLGSTRIGNVQYLAESTPDLRTAAEIKADRRSKFKDSYGPPQRHAKTWQPPQGNVDAVKSTEVEKLQLELTQARSEIHQLRSALHYAGLALQGVGAYDKIPPELRAHLDQHQRMVDELMQKLDESNEERLALQKKQLEQDKLLSHHRHVLLQSIGQWSGDGPLLLAWSAWMKFMRQKHKENAFNAALKKAKKRAGPNVMKAISAMAEKSLAEIAHLIFAKWLGICEAEKRAKTQTEHKQGLVNGTLQMWAGSKSFFAKNMTFKLWWEVVQDRKQAEMDEKRRKQHLEEQRDMKKQTAMMIAMQFAEAGDEQNKTVVLRLAHRAWREYVLDERSVKTLAKEQEAAKAAKDRMTERHFVMLMTNDVKTLKAMTFAGWRDFNQREVIVKTLKLLAAVFHAWRTDTKNHHRQRELDHLREEIAAKEEDHVKQLEDDQTRRFAILAAIGDGQSAYEKSLFLHTIFSAWKEVMLETKRQEEHEAEQKKWQQEFEEQQQKLLDNERRRGIALAFANAKNGPQDDEYLLHIVFSAWLQMHLVEKRDKELEGAQRVFEDDLVRAQRDRDELEQEMQKLDSRYRDQHDRRSALLALQMSKKNAEHSKVNDELLLRICWSAWKEIFIDAQMEAKNLKKELQEHAPSLVKDLHDVIEEDIHPVESWIKHQGCLHRCFWKCCPCTKPKKIPEEQIYKQPGCFARCCLGRKRSHVHDTLESHRAMQHMWDQEPSSAELTGSSPARGSPSPKKGAKVADEAQERLPLRGIHRVTAEDRRDWVCCAWKSVLVQTFFCLAVAGGNAVVIFFGHEDGCFNLLSYYLLGNGVYCVVVLLLRYLWLIGGMLMHNINLVRASQYAKETAEGFNQSINYNRQLRFGTRKFEVGETITTTANFAYFLWFAVFILWCAAGYYVWAEMIEGCKFLRQWYVILTAISLLWSVVQCWQICIGH